MTTRETDMGQLPGEIVIPLTISDHNSEEDQVDRGLAEELRSRIEDLLREEEFQGIAPFGVDLEL